MSFFKHFKLINKGKSRTYLDFASSTPLDERMIREVPALSAGVRGANPGALHAEGVASAKVLREARARVAGVLEVQPDEIVFTSGATESDNLALLGTLNDFVSRGISPRDIVVITSALEHAAVSETIESFVDRGTQHTILPLLEGCVDPAHIMIPEHAKAVLISVMYVSNEIGTVQPIALIAKQIRKLKKAHPDVLFVFHTDATQAPCHFSLRIPSLGIDLMTLGATKLYCNKGVGVLYKKRSVSLAPLLYGGGQEQGLRPGTVPVSLVHEFSFALLYAHTHRAQETARISELATFLESELSTQFPQVQITARTLSRSPHIVHIAIPSFDSELMVLELDARGIAVSAKSACKNEEDNESPVVESLYGRGYGALRVSLGRTTTKRDVARFLKAFRSVLRKYTK